MENSIKIEKMTKSIRKYAVLLSFSALLRVQKFFFLMEKRPFFVSFLRNGGSKKPKNGRK